MSLGNLWLWLYLNCEVMLGLVWSGYADCCEVCVAAGLAASGDCLV